MVQEPIVASQGEPFEPRLEDLQFGKPEPTLPCLDPSVCRVEDHLQDLFALGPTDELVPAKAAIFEPTVVTTASELGLSDRALLEPIYG